MASESCVAAAPAHTWALLSIASADMRQYVQFADHKPLLLHLTQATAAALDKETLLLHSTPRHCPNSCTSTHPLVCL
jgi:hypothetical protein